MQECGDGEGRYAKRLSGPLLDRFDLHVGVDRTGVNDLVHVGGGEPTAVVRRRVERARAQALLRGGVLNAAVPPALLDDVARLAPAAQAQLHDELERNRLTGRGYHRVRRVARTIADLTDDEHHVVGEGSTFELALRLRIQLRDGRRSAAWTAMTPRPSDGCSARDARPDDAGPPGRAARASTEAAWAYVAGLDLPPPGSLVARLLSRTRSFAAAGRTMPATEPRHRGGAVRAARHRRLVPRARPSVGRAQIRCRARCCSGVAIARSSRAAGSPSWAPATPRTPVGRWPTSSVSGLAHAGVHVVWASARGIDGQAHAAVIGVIDTASADGAPLAALGRPIAVVASGLDHVYPEHAALWQRVATDGLMLSGPRRACRRWHTASRCETVSSPDCQKS